MKRVYGLAVLVSISASLFAATSKCPSNYANGQAPDITNTKMLSGEQELCSQGFAVGYSALTRTPLWSAEYITPEHMRQRKGVPRINNFHPDERLSAQDRAELADFKAANRGLMDYEGANRENHALDRGHMTPSADAWSAEVQNETFALSNIIPQNGNNNRQLHAGIEKAVRAYAERNGAIYVITGPIFSGSEIRWIGDQKPRVAIPTHIFKLVYDPRLNAAGAYLENNAPGAEYKEVDLNTINSLTGLSLLPNSAPRKLQLPIPMGMQGGNDD